MTQRIDPYCAPVAQPVLPLNTCPLIYPTITLPHNASLRTQIKATQRHK